MGKKFVEEKEFIGIDFAARGWELGDYESCMFRDCHLAGLDLSETRFIDCTFADCDFSNAKLNETAFQDSSVLRCKCLGLLFEFCSSFSFALEFRECQLDHSSFYQVDLTRTSFVNCSLTEVDFTEANLSGSSLAACDLRNATFDRTRLEKTDLTHARGLRIDPEINTIQGAKISTASLSGLLTKYGLQVVD